jgi:hypothetical protein
MSAPDLWSYVVAAYLVAGGATAALIGWSLAAMRRAEARARALDRR